MSEAGSLIRSLSGRLAARNFHSYVINDIGVGIVSGRFPIGSILPNDAAMMSEYGVSRTVLREALKTLEAKGLVEARPKVGTRVLPRNRWNLFDAQVLSWHFEAEPDRHFIASLFDTRLALELRAADLAARHRNSDHIRLLKYWAHQMEMSFDAVEPFALAELEFHRTIAEASANPFLRSIGGMVELAVTLTIAADAGADHGRSRRVAAYEAHHRLALAIEASDPDAACNEISGIIRSALAAALPGPPAA
ncbi:GntR family transcriptional regulator [Hoeflea marina]|uniref:GntR family transcriptional regulator n=1 Tax=Hoeflea marina TaxID=274592 RepID=A0A317PRR1_9HYPH|nr:FadR/GntR family transcriptional regulator [Hoeflea marina]PWW04161.1 GntR family transcriptional regulator [Hoeflea marina]